VIRAFLFLLLLPACGATDENPSERGARADGPLAVGTRAPAFSAPDQNGETRTLAELRGKAVVLYFYPRDATPGCTAEACAFRDAWDRIEAAGATVVGVSSDDVESHAAFADEHDLHFPLLADTEGEIAGSYGVPSTLGFLSRMTFIIDGSGVIRRVFPDVDPAVHVDEVIEVLDSLAQVSGGGT
jgi:peroxiredoxin Q/BCP